MTCALLEPSSRPHSLELCCASPSLVRFQIYHFCSEWRPRGWWLTWTPAISVLAPPTAQRHRLCGSRAAAGESEPSLPSLTALSSFRGKPPRELVRYRDLICLCVPQSDLFCLVLLLRVWALESIGPFLATLARAGRVSRQRRRSRAGAHFGPLLQEDPSQHSSPISWTQKWHSLAST